MMGFRLEHSLIGLDDKEIRDTPELIGIIDNKCFYIVTFLYIV